MGIQHIISSTGVPTSAPVAVGHSYIDTETGNHYVSVATSTSADWRLQGNFRSRNLNLSTAPVTVYHPLQRMKEQLEVILFNSSNEVVDSSEYIVGGTASDFITIALVTGTLSNAYLIVMNYRIEVNESEVEASFLNSIVRVSGAQSVSEKTLSETLFLKETAPATPPEGKVAVYASSADGKMHVVDPSGNDVPIGSGSGGSRNWVKNPDAESSVTADVTFGAGVTAPTLAAAPLIGTKSFALTSVATASATTWWQWGLLAIDSFFVGKPLSFSIKTSVATAGVFRVSIYNVTDASELTETRVTVPGGFYEAKGFIIPVAGKAYGVRITQIVNGAATVLTVDDVFVGDDPVRYGSGVMRNKSAVFSAASQQTANTNAINLEVFSTSVFSDSSNIVRTSATQATLKAGIKYKITCNCNAENFSDTTIGFAQFSLVIDGVTKTLYQASSLMVTNNTINFQRSGPLHYIHYAATDSVLTILGQSLNGTALLNSGSPICLIEEMEASPTNIQIADRALEEFASNSNSTNTASDTTSFAYGPSGSLIPNGAVGTGYSRTIAFQSNILPTDNIVLEVDPGGNGRWQPASFYFPYITLGSNDYGIRMAVAGATTVSVYFGAGGYNAGGAASWGANSTSPWSALSAWKWRVRKVSGGAQVGFPISPANLSEPIPSSMVSYVNGLRPNTTRFQIGVTYSAGDFTGVYPTSSQLYSSMLVLCVAWDVNGDQKSALYLVNPRIFGGGVTTSSVRIGGDSVVSATFTYVNPDTLRVTNTSTTAGTFSWRYLGGF